MGKLLDVTAVLQAQEEANKQVYAVLPFNAEHVWANGIQEITSRVAAGHAVHFMTDGAWSLHELVESLLAVTGPAEMYVSSYAMSETAVRTLSRLQDAGSITALRAVIDNRIETRTAGSLQLLRSIAQRCALVPCHAKATVLKGADCCVVLVGSANYTENKRVEIGIAIADHVVADFHIEWMNKKIEGNG